MKLCQTGLLAAAQAAAEYTALTKEATGTQQDCYSLIGKIVLMSRNRPSSIESSYMTTVNRARESQTLRQSTRKARYTAHA